MAQTNLEELLADCATFRTWVGASGADAQTQARNRIHGVALPPPERGGEYSVAELRRGRPLAMIWMAPDDGYERTPLGESGAFIIRLEQDVREAVANDPNAIITEFQEVYGAIVEEMNTLSRSGGYLLCRSIMPVDQVHRARDETHPAQGDTVQVDLRVEWGLA